MYIGISGGEDTTVNFFFALKNFPEKKFFKNNFNEKYFIKNFFLHV